MNGNRFHRQSGATLMEVMIAMTISLVVTAAMIAMMSNTLGTTARIIHMSKLTDDMRVAMQMMTRDVRRSSYSANSMLCYANDDCDEDLALADDVSIENGGSCFWFATDREHLGTPRDADAGGFRQVPNGDVGVIEMWTGDNTPDCDDPPGAEGWVEITDPEHMDVFGFTVDDTLSYTQTVQYEDDGVTPRLSQKVRKIRMAMEGRLVNDNSIVREIEDVISVRNDLLL